MKKSPIYIYFIFLAVLFKIALTSSQWLLTIDLHQFHNLYNAEKRGASWFCCCNIPPDSAPCENNPSSLPTCTQNCNTQFFVSVSECQSPPSCMETSKLIYGSLSVLNLDYSFIFILSSSLNTELMLTIEVADGSEVHYQEGIDMFTVNIPFESNKMSQNLVINGSNGIGILNFSYHIQNINNESNDNECSVESSIKVFTVVLTTTISMSACSDKPVSGTNLQSMESSALPSAWIAVAILFMVLTLAFLTISIILMCVLYRRKKVMKAHDIQQGNSLDVKGKFQESADTTLSQEVVRQVDNPLYQVANLSEQPCSERIPNKTEKGNGYQKTTASPYETPVPLAMVKSGND